MTESNERGGENVFDFILYIYYMYYVLNTIRNTLYRGKEDAARGEKAFRW